jgi:hypothetical protein
MEDYEQARQIIERLISSPFYQGIDHKASAQVHLGIGNIIQLRAESLMQSEQELQEKLLQEALNRYLAAVESAQLYQKDIIIEANIICSIKRCRIIKDTIRLWKDTARDLVMAICCGLHNFRVRLNPWPAYQ